ncbi:PP2C family protein-serine/threonine phosphatase [Leptospira adleri]|uniref:PP2C family protein-serine/threonine phosphatase n=1 Tax=Leptospira adleri TaxID=2023186 RepID=UPI0010848D11|nr:PP2C family protein-serine/threonine phosphatase [Leptospira adleri]TGM58794.1 serine/threonine-protein phosphatase [Leptospira adleri]
MSEDLRFEVEMFLSKVKLLGWKESNAQADMDRLEIRQNLFFILREDMVYSLQKILSGSYFVNDSFPDLSPIHREILAILKELGNFHHPHPGRDYSRISLLESWFQGLSKTWTFNLQRVVDTFQIYRWKLYSFAQERPFTYQNPGQVIQRILSPESSGLNFAQIYEAEVLLRKNFQFFLLRKIGAENRLKYLISTEILGVESDSLIQTLHNVISSRFEQLLDIRQLEHEHTLKEKLDLEKEFRQAEKIQKKSLRADLPGPDEKVRIEILYKPVLPVGGDFYTVRRISGTEYGIFNADISGHGIGAALFFNTLKSSFEKNSAYWERPGKLLRKINDEVYGKLNDNFITGIYIYLNVKKKILKYANAGHNKGIIFNHKEDRNKLRFLSPGGKVLGIFPKMDYKEREFKIKEEDRIAIFTDGIPETHNPNQIMLGDREFYRWLITKKREEIENHPQAVIERIERDLNSFRGDPRAEDDICLILIDIL